MEDTPARLPQNPQVQVESITIHEGRMQIPGVHGGRELPREITLRITESIGRGDQVLYLRWNGSKIPRGAKIGDHEVFYASGGTITRSDPENPLGQIEIGTYDRIDRSKEDDPDLQMMVVYIPKQKPEQL